MANFVVSGELKARLEEMASPCAKPAGTTLFQRGDEVAGVFLIEQGKVKLTLDGHSNGYAARKLGPGAVLGLPATLSGSSYSLTAEVVEDAQFAFIPRERMLEFLRMNPLLCFQVTQVLSEELFEMRAAIGSSGMPSGQPKAHEGRRASHRVI
jgi:CRP-like cAMP-binding protein